MFKNYFKTAWRNLLKGKLHAFINIAGLSIGMATAIAIGLWVHKELSFNKYFSNYDRIAAVKINKTVNNDIKTVGTIPLPLDAEMRKSYGSDFMYIVMMSFTDDHTLSMGDKKFSYTGNFMSEDGSEMFTLNMRRGDRRALQQPSSILISQAVAEAMFGEDDPVGKVVKLDNKASFTIAGEYENLPFSNGLWTMNMQRNFRVKNASVNSPASLPYWLF